jgi:hypothetical protein
MSREMPISVHDNKLLSYTVNEATGTILIETVFDEATPYKFTNVAFSNVSAYFFEHHSLQLGTIFFDIYESSTDHIIEDNWERFEEGKGSMWPGDWAKTKETAKAYLEVNAVKPYIISSSCGLSGWVLAQKMDVVSKT